jgi:hypothetical protein
MEEDKNEEGKNEEGSSSCKRGEEPLKSGVNKNRRRAFKTSTQI